MMTRWRSLVWIVLILASAFGLFRVKYRVQAIHSEVASLSHELEQERESLRVAEAEWAYLTRPSRLQRLATRYLRLQPVQARQVQSAEAPRLSPVSAAIPASAVAPQAEGE